MDTLAFGYILPTTGRIRDFNPLETCAARRTTTKEIYPIELNISLLIYLLISFEIINSGDVIIIYYLQDAEYTPLALQYVVQV